MTSNPLLDPRARLVVAHRGNRVAVPENTIESLQAAVELGVDAIEFDVRMTRDAVPVVIHDATLDRTTNGSGAVNARALSELDALDAGAKFTGAQGRRHAIPTLESVLDRFRDVPLVIEVKEFAAAEATERLVRKFGAVGRVLIGSAENRVMEWFYRTGLPTCASMLDAALLIPFALVGIAPLLPRFDVLSVTQRYSGFPIPIKAMARSSLRASIPTHVWTVNDPAEARDYWAAGVSGIVTDDPAAMLRARPQ